MRAVAGVPLHGHVPTPEPVDPQRHAARRALHQRGAAGPCPRLRPGALRVHRHVGRPPHRAAGRPAPVQLRGVLPGFRVADRGPVGAGQPGLGALAGRAGLSTSRPTPTSSTSRSRDSPAPTRTARRGRPARFPVELSQTTFVRQAVVEWLERNGDDALLRPRLVHPAPPAPPEPPRVPRPLPGRRGRALRRVPDARGGGGHPPARRGRRAHARCRRAARRAGAPAAPGHLLRRPARGGRRTGAALRVPASRAGWPTRPWSW